MAGLVDVGFAVRLWASHGICVPNFFNTGAMGVFESVLYIGPGNEELLRRTPPAAASVGLVTHPAEGKRVVLAVVAPTGLVRYYGTSQSLLSWVDAVYFGNGHLCSATSFARLPIAFQAAVLAIYRFSARNGVPANMNPDVICMNTAGGVRLVGREPVASFASPVVLHSMRPHPADFAAGSPLIASLVLYPALAMAIADCGLSRNTCERCYDFAIWNHTVSLVSGKLLQFTEAELAILAQDFGIESTAENSPHWTTRRHLLFQTVANTTNFADSVVRTILENCMSPNVHAPLGNAPLESVVVAIRHALAAPTEVVHPALLVDSPVLASNWCRMDIVLSPQAWLGVLLAVGDVYQVRVFLFSRMKNPDGFLYRTSTGTGFAEFAHFAQRYLPKDVALSCGVSVFVEIDSHGLQAMTIYADPPSMCALRTMNNLAAAVRRAIPEVVDTPRLVMSASAAVQCWWKATVALTPRETPQPDIYDMLWVHTLVPQSREIRRDFLGLMAWTCSNHLRCILHLVSRATHVVKTSKMDETLKQAVQCVRYLARLWADAWDPDDAVRTAAVSLVERVSALFAKLEPAVDREMVTVLAEHATARADLGPPQTAGTLDLFCGTGTGEWATDADVLRLTPATGRMMELFGIRSHPDLFVGCKPDKFRHALAVFVTACLGTFEPRSSLTLSSAGVAPANFVRASHFVGLRTVATETSCAGDVVQTMAGRFPLDPAGARTFFDHFRWLLQPA